jgi:phosphoribosylformylglycinamidine cyclo-ligase
VAESYLSRGVSADKADVHAAIATLDPGLFPGAFCRIVADPSGDPRWASVMHTDGAGTKALVAYLVHADGGRADVFEGIAQDSAVMNVDDVACVGVTGGLVLTNSIARNAHRIDGSAIASIVRGYQRFAEDLGALGIDVTLAGGETADLGDAVQTLVVDSTVFARIERERIIDAGRLRGGEAIVALGSAGRATYERAESSGIGANGLTLARHALLRHEYAERFPETSSPTVAPDRIYQGRFALGDRLPGTAMTVGDALLSPTRTYAPVVKAVLERCRDRISAIIHCTGGGQTKCLRFGHGLHFVKRDLLAIPPVFHAIMETGGIPLREMFQVFNMGHRLEIYCAPTATDEVLTAARHFAIEAKVIGEVRRAPSDKNRLTITAEDTELEYGD